VDLFFNGGFDVTQREKLVAGSDLIIYYSNPREALDGKLDSEGLYGKMVR
jgi:hypothetical protein